jgi:hypothetical protein
MATTHFTWFGVVIDFNHCEITQITSTMSSGATGAAALVTLLGSMGMTSTATVTGVVGALLKLGAIVLNGCNSKQKGIHLFVLWVGKPWCRPQI